MTESNGQGVNDWSALIRALAQGIREQGTKDGRSEGVDAAGTQAVEVCAAAFACGLARGRFGKLELGGVPLDLGIGACLHLAGLSGLAGSKSRDLHNLAEGALATYFTTLGAAYGRRLRQGESLPTLTSLLGRLGAAEREQTSNGAAALPETDARLTDLIRSATRN